MGTATRTRSQCSKTSFRCTPGTMDRDLPLPIEILPGRRVNPSSRRALRSTKLSNCADKENVSPVICNLKELKVCLNERKSTVDPSLLKASKRRKQPVRAPQDSAVAARASCVVREDLETPVASGIAAKEDRAPLESVVPHESNANRNALDEKEKNAGCKQQKGVEQSSGVSSPCESALELLQNNYDKLFMKYQKLKANRLNGHDVLYNEQNSQIFDFVQATEALIEFYKGQNVSLRQQLQETDIPELMSRSKSLEIANSECRIGLVEQQSKNLELRQENKRLNSLLLEFIADKQTSLRLPPQTCQKGILNNRNGKDKVGLVLEDHPELVQRLLEGVLGLRLSYGDDGHLHFEHHPTGFSFNLKEVEDRYLGELVGGGMLAYQNVSLGVCKKAVGWMKEKEVVFGIAQAQLFFKRLTGFLHRGSYG